MRYSEFRWIGVLVAVATIVCGVTITGSGRAGAVTGLERFEQQVVQWRACDDTALAQVGAQCAAVTVPLDYAVPRGRTITVAVSRIPASDPAHRRGVLLTNPGGPGAPGLDPRPVLGGLSAEVKARYDLIGFDPRGVGRSTPVECGWGDVRVPGGDRRPGLTRAEFDLDVAVAARLAAQCVGAEGGAVRQFSTRNTARDMRIIGAVLGESRISYLGASYGTYLGAVFTQMFPEHSDRIVLDSVVDPQRYWLAMHQDSAAANEEALHVWADWVAARHERYRLGADRDQVLATVDHLLARADRAPIEIAGLRVDDDILHVALNLLLSSGQFTPPLAELVHQLRVVADGGTVDPAPIWEPVGQFAAMGSMFQAHMAVKCADVAAPRDPDWYWREVERVRVEQPVFGPLLSSIGVCAFWPAPAEPPTVIGNAVPVLLLHADGDIRTTYPGAQAMHRALTGSALVTLRGARAHGVLALPSACVIAAANTYLRDGVLPPTELDCRLG